jgi:hypothetical protein
MSSTFEVVLFFDMFLPLVKCSRDELLPALFNERFGKDDEVFMAMFDTHAALNIIKNEHKSLRKRQRSLRFCCKFIKNISDFLLWLSGS